MMERFCKSCGGVLEPKKHTYCESCRPRVRKQKQEERDKVKSQQKKLEHQKQAEGHWGHTIRAKRKLLSLNQGEFAEAVGTSQGTVSHFECLPEKPDNSPTAVAMERYLDEHPPELMEQLRPKVQTDGTLDTDVAAAEAVGQSYGRWKIENYWLVWPKMGKR